jgi:hypothetical protein
MQILTICIFSSSQLLGSDDMNVLRGRLGGILPSPPLPTKLRYLTVCRELLVLCCYGECVLHEGSVQFYAFRAVYSVLCLVCRSRICVSVGRG